MCLEKACARHIVLFTLSIGLLLAVVGCDRNQIESPVPSPLSPIGTSSQSSSEAAGGSESRSPMATPSQVAPIPGPEFALDRPLKPGASHISGQGPAGIPIVIVDVTLTGKKLGTGFIDDEGMFRIELSAPLEAGHRIGIMAGTTGDMSDEEIGTYLSQLKEWRGEGARNLPFIGMLFDSAMVPE